MTVHIWQVRYALFAELLSAMIFGYLLSNVGVLIGARHKKTVQPSV